ncbi:MAG: hypothetical protein RBS39_01090 [Phycisphaerales bacterium]|nr:hypothetical protein [Phycisphaerales bacterium]
MFSTQLDLATSAQDATRYHALYESVRSRSRTPEIHKGLDGLVSRGLTRMRARRVTLAFLRHEAEAIDVLAPELRGLAEKSLEAELVSMRERFVRGRVGEGGVRRALALTREAARRETGEEAYVVQLMGALALWHGHVAQMLTGEGKTLTGSLAAPLIAWRRRHLHVFTVNDYLARRDAHSRERLYARCGLRVGAIQQEQEPAERASIYALPIVYGTPKQITADYLRDQIRLGRIDTPWAGRQHVALSGGAGGPIVPGLRAALVDEADAVLIDEGVVPLIIARSRREDDMSEVYRDAARAASQLEEGADYTIDHLRRKSELREHGRTRAREACREFAAPIWRAERRAEELVRQALVARHCYQRGAQYEVVDGRVVIVDEFTGRFLPDRSWEHGLHQAVEAKEGLDVTADRETLARISFQRFFRSYPFLCGMTGTAADARGEIEHVYARPVTVIPTHRPIARVDEPLVVFRTAHEKWAHIARRVQELRDQGRPVLVGTRSIAASERLAALLEARGVPHRVLNANFDQEEAQLISLAGRGGPDARVTVATNMAGRGTDIILDAPAREAGGLAVILSEAHGARRVDRQFIGRGGRQGDPGTSESYASLEDELLVKHAPRLARALYARTREDAMPDPRFACRLVRLAQARAEARDRRMRAAVLKQDDWMDKYMPGR